jgi:hypothetical protein
MDVLRDRVERRVLVEEAMDNRDNLLLSLRSGVANGWDARLRLGRRTGLDSARQILRLLRGRFHVD